MAASTAGNDVHALDLGNAVGQAPQGADTGGLTVAYGQEEYAAWAAELTKALRHMARVGGQIVNGVLVQQSLARPGKVLDQEAGDGVVVNADCRLSQFQSAAIPQVPVNPCSRTTPTFDPHQGWREGRGSTSLAAG